MLYLLEKIRSFAISFLKKIEESNISFGAWFFSFLCFIFLRDFVEILSTGRNLYKIEAWSFFFHTTAFYFFVWLLFILTIHFLTGERIEKVSKASLWMTPLLLLDALIDLIVFQGKHLVVPYLELSKGNVFDILKQFFDYILFGPNGLMSFVSHFQSWGGDALPFNALVNANSYGVKIESLAIVFFAATYVFLKTSSAMKTLLFFFLARTIIFIETFFPSIIALFTGLPINSIFPDWYSAQLTLFSLYFLFITIFAIIWFWRYDKAKFLALVKNVRIERLCLYLGAFFYGIYLSAPDFKFNFFDILAIIMASLAIILSWLFAVGSNDLADEEGDGISKPYRPLPSGKLDHSEVKTLNFIFRVSSYLCALAAGYAFFITILVRSSISYLYSNHPFRLKKYPIISTFCIASGVLLGILGGFLLFSHKDIFDFPFRMMLFILTFFTLGMNFIHIKDREGDKKENVWTIPVIFGEKIGKLITALCLAAAFLSAPLFYPEMPKFAVAIFLAMSLISFWTVSKRRFREWQAIFLCAIFAVLVILFIERPLWPLLWK